LKFVSNPGDRFLSAPLQDHETSLLHAGTTQGNYAFYDGLKLRNQAGNLAGPDIWQPEIYSG
jgi:hypothetical protein